MKSITLDEYKTRIPVGNSEYFNSLDKDGQESYLALYSVYSSLLTDYFIKNFNFTEYDEALNESSCSYPKVSEDKMDIYQYLASDKLDYTYIRNNLYVERLTEEEQTFLIQKAQEEEPKFDDAANEFIGSTFKRVMLENYEDEQVLGVFFGPDNGNFMVPDNSIVIGVRYDDYQKLPGQSSEDWVEENNRRLLEVETLLIIIETRMSDFTGVPTVAIKYNDFSAKKKVTVDEDSKDNDKIM